MVYILIILSLSVFFLAAIVFGIRTVTCIKKNIILGLGFLSGFIYSAFCFAIEINGIIACRSKGLIESCIQYPDINQIPIARIGFDLISINVRLFLMNVLTFGLVFFLIYFFKRQAVINKK